MFNNIPQELRELRQWVMCKADKKPVNPNNGYAAKVNDSSTWGNFEDAANSGYPHIGFVVTPNDPYVFIDLDNKNEDPRLTELHNEIIGKAGDTYVERSISGKGFHIVVKATLAGGRRNSNNGLEIYPRERHMLTTGNWVKGSDIRANQDLVDYLVGLCDKTPPAQNPVVEINRPALEDDEVLREARARYGMRFGTLERGDWEGLHPSQSEADLEFCVNLARFTSNDEQVQGLFLKSGLGQRDKAKRQSYLGHTVRKARVMGDQEWASIEHGRLTWEVMLANLERGNTKRLLETCREFVSKKAPLLKLVKGVLGESAFSVLYGPPGSGKSFLAIDLCYAVATGQEWMGREVTQGPVIYVCGEGATGAQYRVEALVKDNGGGFPQHLYFRRDALSVPDQTDLFKQMLKHAAERSSAEPALLVIDTLSRCFGDGDENSTKDMKKFVDALGSLINSFPRLHILVIHHTGKDQERGMRGSSSLLGAVDTAITCKKDNDRHVATVIKQKDGEEGAILPFVLESVDLGEDEDGEPESSCIVRADLDGRAKPLKGYIATAVKILRKLKDDIASRQTGDLAGVRVSIPLQAYHNHWYLERPKAKSDTVRKNGCAQLEKLKKQGLIQWAGRNADIFPLPALDSVIIELGEES